MQRATRRAGRPRLPTRPAPRRPRSTSAAASAFPISPATSRSTSKRSARALARRSRKRRRICSPRPSFAIELGRWLVGEAGVYLTRIVDRKESRGRTFLVTDGGLHHMLAASGQFRPAAAPQLSGRHRQPLRRRAARRKSTVIGCLCTPLDLLADEVVLPACRGRRPGRDLLRRRLRADAPARRPSSASPRRGRCWSRDRSPRRNRAPRAAH